MNKTIISILIVGVWISASEFFRNNILFNSYWVSHFQNLGITFPNQPKNGLVWLFWSLGYSFFIYILSKRFSLFHNTLLSWFVGFVLMWLVIGNLGVLPFQILVYAVPLSLLETFVAAYIYYLFRRSNKITPPEKPSTV